MVHLHHGVGHGGARHHLLVLDGTALERLPHVDVLKGDWMGWRGEGGEGGRERGRAGEEEAEEEETEERRGGEKCEGEGDKSNN